MKRRLMLSIALMAVAAIPATPVAAQCGCCGHHGAGWRAVAPRAGGGFGMPGQARLYDPDSVATVSGAVTAVEVQPARRGRAGGMHITLSDAAATQVHIGPAWFAQAEGLTFTKGDKVEVTGSLVTAGGETFLIAREVKKGDKVVRLREVDGRPLWAGRGRR